MLLLVGLLLQVYFYACMNLKLSLKDIILPLPVSYISTTLQTTISIKDFFSICDQICSFLRIWLHLLNTSLMENLIFCAVKNLLHVH